MFDALRERILRLKADQRELTKELAMDKFSANTLIITTTPTTPRIICIKYKTKGAVAGKANDRIL